MITVNKSRLLSSSSLLIVISVPLINCVPFMMSHQSEYRRCVVCDEPSSGRHYDVYSCNGCKTFFRRSIHENKLSNYNCSNGGKCQVNGDARCICKYCRFNKCILMGMNRKSLQKTREKIGWTKRHRKIKESPFTTTTIIQDEKKKEIRNERQRMDKMERMENELRLYRSKIAVQSGMNLMEALTDMRTNYYHNDDSSMPHRSIEERVILTISKSDTVKEWLEKDCRIMIEWAKGLPEFECLPWDAQLSLLYRFAVKFPLLMACHEGVEKGKMILPSVGIVHLSDYGSILGGVKGVEMIRKHLQGVLYELKVTRSEYAAFKTISFLNPNVDSLSDESKKSLQLSRDKLTNALHYMMTEKEEMRTANMRFGQLLQLESTLTLIDLEMREGITRERLQNIELTSIGESLMNGCTEEYSSCNHSPSTSHSCDSLDCSIMDPYSPTYHIL